MSGYKHNCKQKPEEEISYAVEIAKWHDVYLLFDDAFSIPINYCPWCGIAKQQLISLAHLEYDEQIQPELPLKS